MLDSKMFLKKSIFNKTIMHRFKHCFVHAKQNLFAIFSRSFFILNTFLFLLICTKTVFKKNKKID